MRGNRWARGAIATCALTLLAVPATANAVERFSGAVRGGVTVTGNTLGLSKASGTNGPGTLGSIGTFIAAGSGQDGTYPVGTTSDWTQNSSAANLALPAGATPVRVELIWGGSFNYGAEDVTASLNEPVTLSAGDQTVDVTPDAGTSTTLSFFSTDGFEVRYYARSADVTSFVTANGAGGYRVAGVPATQADSINSLNAAGWTMVAIYRRAADPTRWVDLQLADQFVDTTSVSSATFEDFCSPDTGPVSAKIHASAMEGDANSAGDQLLAGIAPPLTALSGPNNPVNNFFASQINLDSGVLDTSGSFGTVNHDAASLANVMGGRQSWDVGMGGLSGAQLPNGESELSVEGATTGDAYFPTMFSLELDVSAPRFDLDGATLLPGAVEPGNTTTLTVPVDNSDGTADATSVKFRLPIPAGVDLVSFAVDGVPDNSVGEGDLASPGADLGTIDAGDAKTVTVGLSPSTEGVSQLEPRWDYSFQMCDSGPSASLTDSSNGVTLTATDGEPPETTITDGPPKKTKKKKVKFEFESSTPGSTFECKLDDSQFKSCDSPKAYRLKKGKHTFQVRATDADGTDPSPAKQKVKYAP